MKHIFYISLFYTISILALRQFQGLGWIIVIIAFIATIKALDHE